MIETRVEDHTNHITGYVSSDALRTSQGVPVAGFRQDRAVLR
jgi:hypothetical protein